MRAASHRQLYYEVCDTYCQTPAVAIDGKNTMETQVQEKIVDPNTATDVQSNFVKFEKEKRQYLHITNWRTVEAKKTFEGKEKTVIEFRADVTKSGESAQLLNVHLPPKLLSISNISFRKKINELTAKRDPKTTLCISVKKFGEAKATTYDVEVF